MKTIYWNIATEMQKQKMTKKELAKILKISNVSLYNKLTGKQEWKVREIEILMNLFNQDFEYLIKTI